MLKLSKRLQTVVDMVEPCDAVADIGCDHGYLSIYLLQHRRAGKAIAMDVRSGPLQRAQKNITRYGFDNQIEIRLSDGTEALLPGEVDTLLIAGMGGPLMTRILAEKPEILKQVNQLVLQPQSDIGRVRTFVRKAGYAIQKETMFMDMGKYYVAFRAVRQNKVEEEEDQDVFDWYGEHLLKEKNPVLQTYLENGLQNAKILNQELTTANKPNTLDKREKLRIELEYLKRALEYYKE